MDLLERDSPLRELAAALHDAAGGQGRVALVSGEAGVGKTALVERFARFARERGGSVRVLWGACDALFTPRPLDPLHDMAAQTQGHLLAVLTSEATRTAVFAAALEALQALPTVAVFEDVHWADEATLDLLRFLGRRIANTAALLVLTYRDDELGPRHPLRTLLGDLASSAIARRIQLAPLTEQAVRELVGTRAIDASALHRQTGGNPFFITEVLANPTAGLPSTVRDAVLARAARLSSSAQAVLHAAAVIGPRIEPVLLHAVTAAETEATEECLAAGMFVAQGEQLAFRHELARQAILASMSPPRTVALHRRTLDALRAATDVRIDPARLAHHAAGGGNQEAVLAYAPAAARQAAAASAHHAAAAWYALALRFADGLPPGEHAALLEAYAWECNVIDQRSDGIAARRKAIECWHAAGDLVRQGENLAQLVPMLRGIGQVAEAERCSRAAIALLERLPPGRELALAYRMQAILRLSNRDTGAAIEWGERAIALAERFEDDDVAAMTHIAVGSAWQLLDYERGCSYLERRLAVAMETGRETHVGNAFAYLGAGSVELHVFERAERYLAEGIAYTAARDLDTLSLYMLAWQALTYLHLGRWSEAVGLANQVLRRPSGSALNRIPALVALGRVRARQGAPEARAALDEALELAMPTGNFQHIGLVRAARAEAAWLAGDRARTRDEAGAAYDLAVSTRHPWIAGELAYWRWQAGETEACPVWLADPFALHIAGDWRAAAEEWDRLACPYEHARELAEGDDDARVAALTVFQRLGARPAIDGLRRTMRAAGVTHIPRGPRPATRQNPFGLTTRQLDILSLLSQDLSNAEIAARLYITPKTVDHHVSAVLAKLEVHSRKAAAALAQRHRLLDPK